MDIDHYPAIKDHLLSFGKTRLEQSGQKGSRKKTNNKWFETSDSISYWEDFNQPKIIWSEITSEPKFHYDVNGFFPEATCFFMVGKDLQHIVVFMNSKISQWYFKKFGPEIGGNLRWKEYAIKKMPVPKTFSDKRVINTLKEINTNPPYKLVSTLDEVFYKYIGLSVGEISTLENVITT